MTWMKVSWSTDQERFFVLTSMGTKLRIARTFFLVCITIWRIIKSSCCSSGGKNKRWCLFPPQVCSKLSGQGTALRGVTHKVTSRKVGLDGTETKEMRGKLPQLALICYQSSWFSHASVSSFISLWTAKYEWRKVFYLWEKQDSEFRW